MYCQTCGTPNDDAALFCESCGARLERNKKENVRKKTGKTISKEYIILFSEFVILCVIIIMLGSVGELFFSPEKVAERYFVNVVNGNWENVFKELDIEETPFINAGHLSNANINSIFEDINNYSVVQGKPGRELGNEFTKTDLGTIVKINYRLKGNDFDNIYEISLNKQMKKRYLIFDDWKVGTGNLICQNYSVHVPDGAKVALDGIPLDDTYLKEVEDSFYDDGLKHYVIPELFFGTHTIRIESPDWVAVNEEVTITYNNDEYYLRNMQLSDSTLSHLAQLAVNDMQQIYSAALSGKDFLEIEALFVQAESYRDSIGYDYDDLAAYMNKNDDSMIKQICFAEIFASAETDEAAIRVDFSYQIDYSRKNWWSGDWEADQDQGNGTCYFNFVKEGDQWLLQNLGCTKLYY